MTDRGLGHSAARTAAAAAAAPPATYGTAAADTAADFVADLDGLLAAVHRLTEARRSIGLPHVDPQIAARALLNALPPELPHTGAGGRTALETLAGPALEQVSRLDHPGFLAQMDPPTPWMTWAASLWAAATNQNLLHPDAAPSARTLERLVVGWLAPAFGMGGGHLVPGSTVANLTGLWAARELTGARRVWASTAAHLSIPKAAHILGLELVQVPVDDYQRMRTDLLPEDLSDSVVVLTAGTVATGAIDPLHAAATAAWRHVDAAWAGPLRLSARAGLLEGIQAADSVAVSAHKWLYQPKDSALALFRDTDTAHGALTFGGSYLAAGNTGLLGSSGNRALPLAATLLAWGRDGVAARIEADLAMADHLADLVEDHDQLQLWRRPVTGVVTWRPRNRSPAAVRSRMSGAWVSLADVDGSTWFRSVAANPLADPQHVVQAVLVTTAAFTLDLAARTALTGSGEVHLTPTEWHLLEELVRQPGQLVPQLDLLRAVWGTAYGQESRHYLRVYMAQLRRKLEPEPAAPRHLITIAGTGYRFDP